jgi:hypothetical protein
MFLGSSIPAIALPSMAPADCLHKWINTSVGLWIVLKEPCFITLVSKALASVMALSSWRKAHVCIILSCNCLSDAPLRTIHQVHTASILVWLPVPQEAIPLLHGHLPSIQASWDIWYDCTRYRCWTSLSGLLFATDWQLDHHAIWSCYHVTVTVAGCWHERYGSRHDLMVA